MKTSSNRRTSPVFAAFCPSACARQPTPPTAASKNLKTGTTANAHDLYVDRYLDRPSVRRSHAANARPMAQRGAA